MATRKKKRPVKRPAGKETGCATRGERFYILWNPNSDRPPVVRFDSRQKAGFAATEMARKHGGRFFVMCSIESFAPAPIAIMHTDWSKGRRE